MDQKEELRLRIDMNKVEIKKRIEKLKKSINHYRYQYHVLDIEEISSEALDSLKKELFDLEEKYPEFISKDSPTQRIGGEPLDRFEKFTHPQRMTSFNDAFSQKDMQDWLNRGVKLLTEKEKQLVEFYTEPKLDGLAIELIYNNGVLEVGATRGDGRIGENVTQNLKTIESIPLRLRDKKEVEKQIGREIDYRKIIVRGEAVITKKDFIRINKEREKLGLPLYANPRNLAAGSIRQLDSQVVKYRKLDADIYSLVSDLGQKEHSEEHKLLEVLGFKTNNKYNKICKTLEDVFLYHKELEQKRETLPYEIDGTVVTINNNRILKKLGIVGKAPRGAIAYKFPLKQSTTIIKDVEFQTGRTGAITPVAILKPVLIEGVTISRATLHNEQEIKRLGLKKGDTVVVGRAGDVIPDIIKVLDELRDGKEEDIIIPNKCPTCNTELIRKTGDIVWYCPNKDCYARKLRDITHFVSKQAFNIVGLGKSIVKQLIDIGLINDAADIFSLKKGDLMELEGFEEKASDNLINAINNAKKITFPRFIYALGIDNVGQETAELLADKFESIKQLQDVKTEELETINDIGPIVAQSIKGWFSNEKNIDFINRLENSGILLIFEKKSNKLNGKIFVLTGTMESFSRDEAKEMIRKLGGSISSTVSQNTDYVVLGENPGSKLEKAKKLGIKIIQEKEFYEIIKSA